MRLAFWLVYCIGQSKSRLTIILFNLKTWLDNIPVRPKFPPIKEKTENYPLSIENEHILLLQFVLQCKESISLYTTGHVTSCASLIACFRWDPRSGCSLPRTYRLAGEEYRTPSTLDATHSYFPWSVSSVFSICRAPARAKKIHPKERDERERKKTERGRRQQTIRSLKVTRLSETIIFCMFGATLYPHKLLKGLSRLKANFAF